MKSSEIPRMQFRETNADSELHQQRIFIAKESHRLLGYGRLALALATPGALLYALRELKIEPLDMQKVTEYMQSKEKKSLYSGTRTGILGLVAIPVFVFVAMFMDKLFPNTSPSSAAPLWAWCIYFPSIALAVFSAGFSLVWALSNHWGTGTRKVTSWEAVYINAYEGNIPEHALLKAVQIKTQCPETSFYVSRLIETTDHKARPLPDPFLIAELENEKYIIEVWDETTYKI